MALKEDLLTWQRALDSFYAEDYATAIDTFNEITDCGARIYFNMGAVYASIDRHEDAIISFTNATVQDPYLAIAYFQLGVSQWILGLYREAIESFTRAETNLRNNAFIDYRQLGLDYQLYRFEVLFNRALCRLALKQWEEARADLRVAHETPSIPEHRDPMYQQQAVVESLERGTFGDYVPFSVPEGLMYRPPQQKLDNTKKVDYLGKSSVIASLEKDDTFVGFVGAKLSKVLSQQPNEDGRRRRRSHEEEEEPRIRPSSSLTLDLNSKALPKSPRSPSAGGGGGSSSSNGKRLPRLQIQSNRLDTTHELRQHLPTITSPRVQSPGRLGSPFGQSQRAPFSPTVYNNNLNNTNNLGSIKRTSAGQTSTRSNSVVSFGSIGGTPFSPSHPRIKVKVRRGEETRAIVFPLPIPFSDVEQKIQSRFGIAAGQVRLQYRDEDGEMLVLHDEEDWEMALSTLPLSENNTCKLDVYLMEEHASNFI